MKTHICLEWNDNGQQRLACGYTGIPGIELPAVWDFDLHRKRREPITCKRCLLWRIKRAKARIATPTPALKRYLEKLYP